MDVEQLSLAELKVKTPADLLSMAEELEIENAPTMRKGDMMFAILKEMAEEGVESPDRHHGRYDPRRSPAARHRRREGLRRR